MSIDWQPTTITTRDGLERHAEQGQISVPEDRTNSATGDITLEFVRLKAKNPTGHAPVVFLSGGPGDSGIQWASHGPFLEVFEQVAEHTDLILLDQRGTGASGRRLSVGKPTFQADDLASEEGVRAFAARHIGAAAQKLREQEAPFHAYTAPNSALDIDALREALGVDKVSIWGYSYGTHLTQMAVKQFEDRIERVVLCGFEGPNQTFKFPHQLDAQLRRINVIARGFNHHFLASVRKAHEVLATDPVEVEGIRFGAFALRALTAGWCGISNRFNRLPALYASLAEGNSDVLAASFKDYLRIWQKPMSFYLKDASSGATAERWEAIHAQEADSFLGSATNFPFPEIGPIVGVGDIGDEFRKQLESSLPFFVITGSLDGFTPTENAVEGLTTLPNAHHVEIKNAAHNDLLGSPEVVQSIAAFLGKGETPTIEEAEIKPPRIK